MKQDSDRYNFPQPRYTSYPTHPNWNNRVDELVISNALADKKLKNLSLYVHLPFCEQLCTYCGCNTRITKNHAVEKVYISHLLEEAKLYAEKLNPNAVIDAIHLGGGTPTFFAPANLFRLIYDLKDIFRFVPGVYSFEAHPAHTKPSQLEALRMHGFNRISIGVQDFSQKVLNAINRPQQPEQIIMLVNTAKKLGFSINFDMVYGLPFQTSNEISRNLEYIKQLRPGRIAWYAYAHVPWKKPGQRGYSENDLPNAMERSLMYNQIQTGLQELGYQPIGFDHFALPDDELCKSYHSKALHRNFMGYVEKSSDALLGIGASSISEFPRAYWQNEKLNEIYYQRILKAELPVIYGHSMQDSEITLREQINRLLCYMEVAVHPDFEQTLSIAKRKLMQEMLEDGLITFTLNTLKVTLKGRKHLRLAAALIDPAFEPQISSTMYSAGV
jgi:oxygen-independent coproporphyrinogen-3 oxidase